ncbi:MAG TPA: hypothetical protein VG815_08185, partial [Chloroflexota bacterium]|nr:hypothetical protein [Chloroflexota bacterium]
HYVLTYDGNGLLQEALYRYPSGRTCPNIVRRHVVRREVSRHSTDRTFQENLTWNTALGTPTLAGDNYYATGVDEGWTGCLERHQWPPRRRLANTHRDINRIPNSMVGGRYCSILIKLV